jgi:hypothetical protein
LFVGSEEVAGYPELGGLQACDHDGSVVDPQNVRVRSQHGLSAWRAMKYVSMSLASIDAQIFTNDFSGLGQKLEHDVAKTSAVDFSKAPSVAISDTGLDLAENI